jgi:hypothetical protein
VCLAARVLRLVQRPPRAARPQRQPRGDTHQQTCALAWPAGVMLDDLIECVLGDRPANPVQYAIEHLRTTYADVAVTAPATSLATRFGALLLLAAVRICVCVCACVFLGVCVCVCVSVCFCVCLLRFCVFLLRFCVCLFVCLFMCLKRCTCLCVAVSIAVYVTVCVCNVGDCALGGTHTMSGAPLRVVVVRCHGCGLHIRPLRIG